MRSSRALLSPKRQPVGTEYELRMVEVGGVAPMAVVPMYAPLVDPSCLPKHLTVGDMLYRIAAMDPAAYHALEKIIADVYKRDWERQHRTDR